MERLVLKTDKADNKIIVKRDLYNMCLDKVTFLYKQNKRLQGIVFDAETELMEIEKKLQELKEEVVTLEAWEEAVAKKIVIVRKAYESCPADEQASIRQMLTSFMKEYHDCVMDLSDNRYKLNQLAQKYKSFELIRHRNLVQMGTNELNLEREVEKLRVATAELETLLGYTIGSHMIDWCYDSKGKVTSLPQLLPIDIEFVVENKNPECTAITIIEQ